MDSKIWVYDIETYPNIFTFQAFNPLSKEWRYAEISDRVNHFEYISLLLDWMSYNKCRMVGFNNVNFDYPVVHHIINDKVSDPFRIYERANEIIQCDNQWSNRVYEPLVEQIDLYLINHFDNMARATSLKKIEIYLRMESVQDLPFEPGEVIPVSQFDELHSYNRHDVKATALFLDECYGMVELRDELSKTYGLNFQNKSNSKMGSMLCEKLVNEAGIITKNPDKSNIQTNRSTIELKDCILPYINDYLTMPEFVKVKDFLSSMSIKSTKGVFKDLVATHDELDYVFGLGGIHASRVNQIFETNDDFTIIDVDVSSMYPSIALMNNLYPEHLGVEFTSAYDKILKERKKHDKGTSLNLGLKEAANATYGNSNSKFSCFYDPKYTMTTTISGQLSLCILIQEFVKIPGLTMIQANTDGVTAYVPKFYIEHFRNVCKWWESITHLTLEEVIYSKMVIRDVNNYIAVKSEELL